MIEEEDYIGITDMPLSWQCGSVLTLKFILLKNFKG